MRIGRARRKLGGLESVATLPVEKMQRVDGVSGAAPGSALRDVCVRSGERKLVPDQSERLPTAGCPLLSTRGAVSPLSVRIKTHSVVPVVNGL